MNIIPIPVREFATTHPGFVPGLETAAFVVLSVAAIIGGTKFLARKIGIID
jgi:hypothetical protein